MYTITATIAAVIAAAPPSTESPPRKRVETNTTDTAAELLVYDDAGELEAVLVLQAEPDGDVRMDVDFHDGVYLTAVTQGDDAAVETNDGPAVADRMAKLDAPVGDALAGTTWRWCALHILGATAACGSGAIALCGLEAYAMACKCLPLTNDEWKDHECAGLD
jgi:hypothetical protein